jgi:predicted nucleotidyltransferase
MPMIGSEQSALVALLRQHEAVLSDMEVRHFAIFGSRAHGDHRADSDLNVLLDVPWKLRFSLLDLVGIEQFISDRAGLSANAFMRGSLDDDFAADIHGDTIRVY